MIAAARHGISCEVFCMNPVWAQPYLLFGQGLAVSAMIAIVPTLLLLYLLAVRKKASWIAASAGLGATVALGIGGYGMSAGHAFSAAAYGACFGVFPISWI